MATPFPPHHALPSTPISTSKALSLISSYLHLSTLPSHTHLLPNTVLTSSGPVVKSGGAAGNLTLHNLRRVQKGLEGEWLAPSLEGIDSDGDGEGEGGEEGEREEEGTSALKEDGVVTLNGKRAVDDARKAGKGSRAGKNGVNSGSGKNVRDGSKMGVDESEWQDLATYQREQSIDGIGEVLREESTLVGQEGEEMMDTEIEVLDRGKQKRKWSGEEDGMEGMDAEARREAKKAAKKERRKVEKSGRFSRTEKGKGKG